uniref:Uncharacterized protein n=1 Tax=Caenorhabditis japonica TaxID=281687 RepID=A0A8R1EQ17_CAEJA
MCSILSLSAYFKFLFPIKCFTENLQTKNILPGRELNPGLACDRRGYSPLYYRGHGVERTEDRTQIRRRFAFFNAVTEHCASLPHQDGGSRHDLVMGYDWLARN